MIKESLSEETVSLKRLDGVKKDGRGVGSRKRRQTGDGPQWEGWVGPCSAGKASRPPT